MTPVVVGEAPHEALQVMFLHRVQHLSSLCQLREKRGRGEEAQHDLGVSGKNTELLEVVLALEKSKVATGSSQPDQAQEENGPCVLQRVEELASSRRLSRAHVIELHAVPRAVPPDLRRLCAKASSFAARSLKMSSSIRLISCQPSSQLLVHFERERKELLR